METLFLSALAVAELRAGVAMLPIGKRRAAPHENLEKRVLPLFGGRILPRDWIGMKPRRAIAPISIGLLAGIAPRRSLRAAPAYCAIRFLSAQLDERSPLPA